MSEIKVNTWKNGAGTRTFAPCTAWVNFNGTGTVAIRDQLNVSSITDNGVGDYTVNFTTAMANVNYSVVMSIGINGDSISSRKNSYIKDNSAIPSTSAVRLGSGIETGSANNPTDCARFTVAVFGGI